MIIPNGWFDRTDGAAVFLSVFIKPFELYESTLWYTFDRHGIIIGILLQ